MNLSTFEHDHSSAGSREFIHRQVLVRLCLYIVCGATSLMFSSANHQYLAHFFWIRRYQNNLVTG